MCHGAPLPPCLLHLGLAALPPTLALLALLQAITTVRHAPPRLVWPHPLTLARLVLCLALVCCQAALLARPAPALHLLGGALTLLTPALLAPITLLTDLQGLTSRAGSFYSWLSLTPRLVALAVPGPSLPAASLACQLAALALELLPLPARKPAPGPEDRTSHVGRLLFTWLVRFSL